MRIKCMTRCRFQSTFFIILILSLFSTASYAFVFSKNKIWHPVISIGSGDAISSNVGEPQTFPIQNPNTDEFYDYSVDRLTQSSFLIDGFLGVEFNLIPSWALQLGIDYNQTNAFTAKGPLIQGADSQSEDLYQYRFKVIMKQLLLESKCLYTVKKIFHPYLLAGFGAAFNTAYNYYTNVPSFLTFTRMYDDNTESSFSYLVGFGIDIDLTSHVRLGAGYRFADFGHVELGNATIDMTHVNGTLSQDHLYANEWLAQITYIV
jgi:opacity protein-like surface antigen